MSVYYLQGKTPTNKTKQKNVGKNLPNREEDPPKSQQPYNNSRKKKKFRIEYCSVRVIYTIFLLTIVSLRNDDGTATKTSLKKRIRTIPSRLIRQMANLFGVEF